MVSLVSKPMVSVQELQFCITYQRTKHKRIESCMIGAMCLLCCGCHVKRGFNWTFEIDHVTHGSFCSGKGLSPNKKQELKKSTKKVF